MQDELRADMLFRVLAGEEPSPDETDDEELRALVGLGARLDALRPALAALDRAEQAFSPGFAQGLHRTVVAAHPAVPQEQAANHTARAARRTVQWMSRRLLALLALIAALAVIAIAVIVQGGRQTAQVGAPALNPTRQAPRTTAMSFAASAPHATPSARQGAGTPAPNLAAPLRLGSAPTGADGSPTPPKAYGSANASGAAPMQRDTIVPHAAAGPGPFRYRLPTTLPTRPSSVPLYRVLQTPITEARARGIAATFAGMRPIMGAAVLTFDGGGAQLRIIQTTSVADYTRTSTVQAPPAPTVLLTSAQAIRIARGWLITHLLLPKKAGPLTVSLTRQGAVGTVRFTPTLQIPLLGSAQTPAATVEVDGAGNVVAAHAAWASLQPTGTAAIVSPSAATSGAGAPKATDGNSTQTAVPLITVKRVILSYELEGRDGALILRPVYQLTGTLEGQPVIQIVSASRNGT